MKRKKVAKKRKKINKRRAIKIKRVSIKHKKNIIGIHIGSGTIGKRWPIEKWIKLFSILPQFNFYVFYGHKELEIIDKIQKNKNIMIISRSNLINEISKLQECDLFISGDTGFLHLAESLGVKVIALMGQTNPKRYGPYFSSNKYICKTDYFNPKTQDNNPSLYKINPSMYKITPEEVKKNIEEMLSD